MNDLKRAVERLADMLDDNPRNLTACGVADRDAIRLVLSALSKAEAERDLLAAECRAWRVLEHDERNCNEAALTAALAATDAAGVLEPRSGDIVLREGK